MVLLWSKMRRIIKRVASLILIPITRWYLRKERSYSYSGTKVRVPDGVFHPGLFHSTKFLIEYMLEQELYGKTILELGCGSGLISVIAAKHGAVVTASDVNMRAVKAARLNANSNGVEINVIHSDLFENIPRKMFNFIFINPPYYRGQPKDESEMAWFAGKDLEYFKRMFAQLSEYFQSDSVVIMSQTLESPMKAILSIGESHNLSFELVREKAVLFDGTDFLFKISKKDGSKPDGISPR